MSETQSNGAVRYRIRSDALDWLDVDGEIVILDSDRSVYLSINHSGAHIWRLLVDGATPQEIAANLAETYGIDLGRATEDAEQFIALLGEHDLIEPS